MKKSIKLCLLALGLVLACVAAMSPARHPLAPYQREQTKGKIRVVLLKVERATIFSTTGIKDPKPDQFYPVPVLGVTYMIEALGDEPVRHWTGDQSNDDLTIGSRREPADASLPENLTPGVSSGVFGPISHYANGPVELPKSFNEQRSTIQELHERAVPSKTGNLRLQLKVGFNDQRETFVFDNLPVN